MDDRLAPVTNFNTAQDLSFFYRQKQNDLAFMFSKPREFDGEFVPLLCYAAFYSSETLFRLVPQEETIRDAEMRLVSGEIVGIQITQAMALEYVVTKEGQRGFYRPFTLTHSLAQLAKNRVACDVEILDRICQRLLTRIAAKVQRYATLAYPSDETILLVFMNDPGLGQCFEATELLTEMKNRIPAAHLSFFAEIHILYMESLEVCTLVNMTRETTAHHAVELR